MVGSRLDIHNWPPVCISWGRKMGFRMYTYNYELVFPETRDRWAPSKAFNFPRCGAISWGRKKWASGCIGTTSLLFALHNGNNNRNRVNSQCLSLKTS